MHRRLLFTLLISSLVAGAAGCASRTAAATQKTPAAFDPNTSDQQALAAVDEMLAALGGAEKWAAVKQIRWEVKYKNDGQLQGWFKHSWDIWNGRHRYEFASKEQVTQPKPVFIVAMYDLFDHKGKGFVTDSDHPYKKSMSADRDAIIKNAYDGWQRDAYRLTMFYKLRDPGVQLKYSGERPEVNGKCKNGCIDIKVSYVPEVGKDTYHLLIDKQTKLPEVIEKGIAGGTLAFGLENWTEVKGLKFPTVFKNLGPDERFEIENIRIGKPDDALYVPRVVG